MKRANIYLALTKWAAFRGEALTVDEDEGNIEFASILFMIDGCEDGAVTLGARLGGLSAYGAERLAAEVADLVQSETGELPLTESETTNNQPESK
jgi:hypothetical protein